MEDKKMLSRSFVRTVWGNTSLLVWILQKPIALSVGYTHHHCALQDVLKSSVCICLPVTTQWLLWPGIQRPILVVFLPGLAPGSWPACILICAWTYVTSSLSNRLLVLISFSFTQSLGQILKISSDKCPCEKKSSQTHAVGEAAICTCTLVSL